MQTGVGRRTYSIQIYPDAMGPRLQNRICMTRFSSVEAAHLMQAGYISAAEALCRRILVLLPEEGDAWNVLGFAAAKSGDTLQALICFHRAVILMPEVAGIRFNLGVARLGQGELLAAIDDLEQVLILEPEMGDAHAYLAYAFGLADRIDEAVRGLKQALLLETQASDPLLRLTVLLHRQYPGQISAKALERAYRRVLVLAPKAVEARINLGVLLRERGALHEACGLYVQVLNQNPERIEIYGNLGELLLDTGRVAEALECCQRGVTLWPDYPLVHNALGSILHHSGQLEAAAVCYRRSLVLEPDNDQARANLAALTQDAGGINPNVFKNINDVLENPAFDNGAKFKYISTVILSCMIDRMRGKFLRTHTPHVQAGPFAGMLYHRQGREGCYLPKVLGTYEAALHPFLEQAISRQPQVVINIGAADGYYAVGLALRLPEAQVFAYDTDIKSHRSAQILAGRNGVAGQISVYGEFRVCDFARFAGVRSLLVCDIEGAEFALLDPLQAPALASMDIIVEMHAPEASPQVRDFLARFVATHDICVRDSAISIVGLPEFLRSYSQIDQMLALWEARPGPTPWAILWARS